MKPLHNNNNNKIYWVKYQLILYNFNQAVHVEMQQAMHEKDDLKLRVHSYITEVAKIEKLMATKASCFICCVTTGTRWWWLNCNCKHTSFMCLATHTKLTECLTGRSRRTGTWWNSTGWLSLRWWNGTKSCVRWKVSTTLSAWSFSLQTQNEGTSPIQSPSRRGKSVRWDVIWNRGK